MLQKEKIYGKVKSLEIMNVKEKLRNLKIFRVIVQIIFFIFMPSLLSQAFAGVKEAVALIGKGENLILSDFVIKLLILCTVTIIFGRIFCGFVCSFGDRRAHV